VKEVDWREQWEREASDELARLREVPSSELLAQITRGDYGRYYQIWYALEGRTTIEEAGALLLRILHSSVGYLIRYHCANLLLSLFNLSPGELDAVKLSGREKYDVDRNLEEYERALHARA
jgi:hypothetical protein